MYDSRRYDSPPLYSPPYSTVAHSLYPPRSMHSPQSRYQTYSYTLPDGYYTEEKPQHFYRLFSPPGFVKTFHGATVLMCFLIFACVASTLVWDMNGFGYGGVVGSTGSGPGYYGGTYGYVGSYMTPQSAKSAMISIAAINFLVSLGFLVGSFSRSRAMRGCHFYLTVFICDIILAILQVSGPQLHYSFYAHLCLFVGLNDHVKKEEYLCHGCSGWSATDHERPIISKNCVIGKLLQLLIK